MAAQASEQSLVLSTRQLIGPLIAIIVGMFMVILDTTAVNVALPVFVDDFHRSLTVVQWTITGYALAQAAVIPLAGWMSDQFGAKRIFIISLVLFTLGSVLCAVATTAEQLILFRVLQGLGGGMVMPIAFAMTFRMSPPEKAGSIMGMMGIPILLAPALGPMLAGYLVDYVSWHWIFYINVPVGIIGLVLCVWQLPNLPKSASTGLDKWGIVLGPLAFAGLSYGISEGGAGWTTDKTIIGLAVGAVALGAFIAVELTRKGQPLLELRVFRSMLFTRGIIIQWVLQFAMFGIIFLIPYFMQRIMGMSAFHAGMWSLPQALAAALFMPFGGRLYDRIGARPLVIAGMVLVATGAYLISRITPDQSAWAFFIPRALLGMGMGLSFLPLNTFLIQSAPANLVSRVTSLTSATQQVVTSFAVAGLTTIVVSRTNHHVAEGLKPMPDAIAKAFHDTYLMLAALAVVALVLGLTIRKPKGSPTSAEQEFAAKESMMG
ncbi:DHA2 family efflux MFS transporter permease subunit [Paenibacillus sp. MMS18-CY102]|uniref:DHA2 family efflux MFS transporter permease subunit n=1 Tax=Paenibacillus sp. MMS18-CY102 TaxID=2682849 RepID=UPI00136644A8|nr:DHA2 family efflux MFS transporter permease subunit [Paenibacillus sp. MMS18-CY102]MWC28848.1 DHA2 family efflux MFS transporter permease subunit [Paenibacillus sp. MMS18-CY102]